MSQSGIRTLPTTPAPTGSGSGERDYEAEAKLRVLSLKDAFGFDRFPSTFEEALSFARHPDCKGMSVVNGKNGVNLKIGQFQYSENTQAGRRPSSKGAKDGKKFGIWQVLRGVAVRAGIPQSTISKTIFPMESWKCAFAIWLLTPESA